MFSHQVEGLNSTATIVLSRIFRRLRQISTKAQARLQRLPNVNVWMVNQDITCAPRYDLPVGYRMRFYRDGDLETWVRIQQAAERYFTPTADNFARAMPGETDHLATRVMFLTNPSGVDIGTITAWEDSALLGRSIGVVHWVAIIPAAQGRGLAKPMISAILDVLRSHGHRWACLETDTRRVKAIRVYSQFGFAAFSRNEQELAAWRTIAPRLEQPLTFYDRSPAPV